MELPASAKADPRRVLEVALGVPFTTGNRVDVLRNGEETFPALLSAICGARCTLDVLWFSWGTGAVADEIGAALADRARAGVKVRVLRASSAPGWDDSALALATLLQLARQRVRVATPYARLPPWLGELVATTVGRGVQVQLLVSGPYVDRPTVHRQAESEYQQLLEAGVEIWRYQVARMHTKLLTVDGSVAMVGTTNFDRRSVDLNEQIALVLQDTEVVGVLDGQYDEDLLSSQQVTLRAWRARGRRQRLAEAAASWGVRPLGGWGTTGLTGPRPGLRPRLRG